MMKNFVALLLLVFPCLVWGQGSTNHPASIDSKTCSNSEEFYPRESRLLNQQGTVVLRFNVEADGRLAQVEVERSSGFERLDLAAKLLLYSCKFKPGTVNGKLEKTSATLEVIWKLDGTESNPVGESRLVSTLPPCPEKRVTDRCFGKLVNGIGAVYVGEILDSKAHGYGILYSKLGQVAQSGEWREGIMRRSVELEISQYPFQVEPSKDARRDRYARVDGEVPKRDESLPACGLTSSFETCFGRLVNGIGAVYVGEVSKGKAQGVGILYSRLGDIVLQGRWNQGSLEHAFDLSESQFPFNHSPKVASTTPDLGKTERDRLTAEVEAERKRREELEKKLAEAEAKEREQRIPPPPTQVTSPRNPHALIIGNAAYPGSARLDNPINDANAVAQKLKTMGFTVTVVTDANRQRLVQAMSNFRKTASSADLSLLFYSGHGVQIFGTNYILPTDADQTDVAQATIQGVSLNSVVENFLPGKTKIVFLDACRDNPLQRTGDRTVSKGLAPISVAQGTLIAYATKDGQTASDGVGQKNSPFTKALLEHLSDPQDIAVILRKVREKVMTATGGKQQPWEYGSLTGGELVLSGVKR